MVVCSDNWWEFNLIQLKLISRSLRMEKDLKIYYELNIYEIIMNL